MESKGKILYATLGSADWATGSLDIPEAFYMGVCQGNAIVQIRNRHFFLEYQSELHQFGGCKIQSIQMSADFKARIFTYPRTLLDTLFKSIGYGWYDFFDVNPFYQHVDDPRSQRTWREFNLWLDLAQTLFSPESKIKYSRLQQEYFLAGYWMWATGTVQEKMELSKKMSQSKLLYRRFLKLVHQEAANHHDVKYYAETLSITPRYLCKIVSENSEGAAPKHIIDCLLVDEIKLLLDQGNLTLSQIADRLSFPDQSYLSRFFHRLTGMYPTFYKNYQIASKSEET